MKYARIGCFVLIVLFILAALFLLIALLDWVGWLITLGFSVLVPHMWDDHRMGDEIFKLKQTVRELQKELREAKGYDW